MNTIQIRHRLTGNKTVKHIVKKTVKQLLCCLLILSGFFICLPTLLILTGSFFDSYELEQMLEPAFANKEGFLTWKLMPDYPTFDHYGRLLFLTPQFFVLFWNSVKIVTCILAGQLFIGVPAAWAFAAYPSGLSRKAFALYVVLMLLPFQVTMLSSYLVLNKFQLLNTHGAVILPAIFSTFPIFLTYGAFKEIPLSLLEAARIDGAGELKILLEIALPLGKNGIFSALILGFLEYWNIIEQPLAFFKDKALWPLSLYLPEIVWTQAGFSFAASLITLIPAAFVFWLGQDYLEQGIIYSGLKT